MDYTAWGERELIERIHELEKELQGKTVRLYHHKTDGGAEYLCSEAVEGTDEGSFNSKYIVRIDGDITKDAELNIRN